MSNEISLNHNKTQKTGSQHGGNGSTQKKSTQVTTGNVMALRQGTDCHCKLDRILEKPVSINSELSWWRSFSAGKKIFMWSQDPLGYYDAITRHNHWNFKPGCHFAHN